MTLSVPTRYIHTVTECVHKTDLQSAIDCWPHGWQREIAHTMILCPMR